MDLHEPLQKRAFRLSEVSEHHIAIVNIRESHFRSDIPGFNSWQKFMTGHISDLDHEGVDTMVLPLRYDSCQQYGVSRNLPYASGPELNGLDGRSMNYELLRRCIKISSGF